jgi:hypothetical protein
MINRDKEFTKGAHSNGFKQFLLEKISTLMAVTDSEKTSIKHRIIGFMEISN